MDKPSAAEIAGRIVVWTAIVGALVVWRVRLYLARRRRVRALMNSPMDAWVTGTTYAPRAPATAEGSYCPCGRGFRVRRLGDFGPFLGCSTWIDPGHGCQRACFLDGRPLPPAMWRRNRRIWFRSV